MGKCAIITLATPLNRIGNESGTDPLSHSIVNQTKYFGFKATRLITGLFKGVATTNSNRSDWAGGFLLTKWTGRKSAYNTPTPLAHNERDAFTVASQNIPPTPLDGQDLDHLSEAELSQLLDLLLSQVEHHRDELARLKPILHRLQARIPNQPFLNFINELEF